MLPNSDGASVPKKIAYKSVIIKVENKIAAKLKERINKENFDFVILEIEIFLEIIDVLNSTIICGNEIKHNGRIEKEKYAGNPLVNNEISSWPNILYISIKKNGKDNADNGPVLDFQKCLLINSRVAISSLFLFKMNILKIIL